MQTVDSIQDLESEYFLVFQILSAAGPDAQKGGFRVWLEASCDNSAGQRNEINETKSLIIVGIIDHLS